MIVLRDLTKVYSMAGHRKVVADHINATFPTGLSVALLGRNGAGKSTLLQMIAGTVHPTSGDVLSDGRVSFPVGLASSLNGDLTGAQNTRFVARIYGADTDELMTWVEEFAELGPHFHLPVRSYSSGMRARLSFGINMGLNFDTYLVDEVTAVGDADFKRKSRDVFLSRMQDAGAIFVSHSMGMIKELCQAGAVLEQGRLTYFHDVGDAIDRYNFSLDPGRTKAGAALPGGAGQTVFPFEARMLYGMGLPFTQFDWVADCMRRHRATLFPAHREPHYFDMRAGLAEDVQAQRLRNLRDLTGKIAGAEGPRLQKILGSIADIGAVLALQAAPRTGPDRHAIYVSYLLNRRTHHVVICDFTPTYARLPFSELTEMAAIGAGRFVVLLRDPADRLWAEIWTAQTERGDARIPAAEAAVLALAAQHAGPVPLPPDGVPENLPENLSEAGTESAGEAAGETAAPDAQTPAFYTLYPEADYAGLFARFAALVPPERVLYLFHENLPDRQEIDRVTTFLDIPALPRDRIMPFTPDSVPPCPPQTRARLQALLAPQYAAAKARLGARLPARWSQADEIPAANFEPAPEPAPAPAEVTS